MCPDARILEEILKSERADGWMGETWFTSNIQASHYFRILLREQSIRRRVPTQIFFDDQR
jgi:hypothetical protein